MLEEILLIIITFKHLTTQTYWTQLFRPFTESRHLEELCFKGPASVFPVGKSIEYERRIKIRTVQLSVSVSNMHTWPYAMSFAWS